jgi:proteasome lid subunit RPN8/RPN11
MTLRLSRGQADAVRAQARAAAPRECCGLLLGDAASGTVEALRPAANVAEDPVHRFEIDPAVLIAAHRAARTGGPAILGHYHSHPGGDPAPSETDAAQAEGRGEIWLIVGAGGALAAWRAMPPGRFEPVQIETVPESHSCTDAPAPALGRA